MNLSLVIHRLLKVKTIAIKKKKTLCCVNSFESARVEAKRVVKAIGYKSMDRVRTQLGRLERISRRISLLSDSSSPQKPPLHLHHLFLLVHAQLSTNERR